MRICALIFTLLSMNAIAAETTYKADSVDAYKKDAEELVKQIQQAVHPVIKNSSLGLVKDAEKSVTPQANYPCCIVKIDVKIPFDGSYCQCTVPHQGPCKPMCE